MPRTPEQVAADEAVRDAVIAQLRAYGWDEGGVLTDFVVLGNMTMFGDAGEPISTTFSLHAEEAVPLYRLLGLCEAAAAHYRADLATPAEDE